MSSFTFGFNVKPRRAGGVSYDADALAYFNANTSITSTADKNAINTFFLGLKSDGIYSKIKAMYLPLWSSATANKWNLVNPLDTNAAFRLTFSTGWTHASTGMTPTNAYAETFFNPVTQLTNYKAHIGLYIGTNTATGIDYGVATAAYGNEFWMTSRYSGDLIYLAMYDMDNAGNIGWIKTSSTDSRGFTLGTAQSNVSLKVFKNGTEVASKTTTNTTTPVNDTSVIGAAKISPSTIIEYSNKQYRFISKGDDLTDTQAANFSSRVNTLMTYFGLNTY